MRAPWLNGIYAGRAFCDGRCAMSELVTRLWWWDGQRLCATCFETMAETKPPIPKTAAELEDEK